MVTTGMAAASRKAFTELQAAGFIDRAPKLAVVRVAADPDGYAAFDPEQNMLAEAGDAAVELIENEIPIPKHVVGKDGIGADPASVATVAGCKKLVQNGTIGPSDSVVCLFTGHLLKDPEYTADFHRDRLYLDAVRTTTVEGKRVLATMGSFNMRIKLPADAKKVLEYLEL
jgi:threonine synthase